MAELLEFIKSLFEESIPWLAPIIAPAILYFRWVEKKNRQTRERRIESKLDYLIELEGGRWNVEKPSLSKDSAKTTSMSLRLVISLVLNAGLSIRRKGIKKYTLSRRNETMNQNINWATLIPALLGVLKLILQPFGIDLSKITDDQVNAVINGAAALIAIWGVFKSHTKQPAQTQQPNSKQFIQG
jgi:uncharacterized membrane protein